MPAPAKSPSVHVQESVDSMKEMMIEAEREIAVIAFGEESIDEYMKRFIEAFNGNGPYGVMVSNEKVLWKSHAIQRGRLLAFPIDSLEIFLGTSNQSTQTTR